MVWRVVRIALTLAALASLVALPSRPSVAQSTRQGLKVAAPLHVQRLLAVGDPVPAAGRLGMFRADPSDPDRDISTIRRAADDGSLFVADYAGSALLRVGEGGPQLAGDVRHSASRQPQLLQAASGKSEILLDTTARDPMDGVGLARLLRVETGRDGTNAILALRADHNRGIYRLSNGVLSRLALLPGATGPAELAIGDSGQIAYIAPTPAGAFALSQVTTPPPGAQPRAIELLSQGQSVLNGAAIAGFSNLTSNGAGDLAVRLLLRRADGSPAQAVMRKTNAGLTRVAVTGQPVARESRGNNAGLLIDMRQPRIGPGGTVAFLGTGDGFANFYVARPNRPLQPMLPGVDWNPADGTYDYEIAADGAVALRAAPGQSTEAALYLVPPTGAVIQVAKAGERIQPIGQPVFGPDGTEGLLFFLARNLDRPVDRNGQIPVVLCRSRLAHGSAVVDAVAAPGQPVPGKRGAQLLTITQRPVVSATAVTFGALFGGGDNSPVPSAGLFRVPLGGTLADATLVAEEGADLPGADRVAMLRSLAYTADGTLLFGGLLPGAGSLVATAAPPQPAATAARARPAAAARIQAGPPGVTPLLAIGQPLDRPDRRLLAVLGRFVALGASRQLLVARFSQSDSSVGEGLFSLARDGQVQALAVTGDPAPAPAGARFTGFADTSASTLNPPAVSADANVVFKAKLDRGGTATFGVFEWNGTAISSVGVADPNPDNLALTPDDRPPYDLDRWSAGAGGDAYLMERHQTRTAVPVTRLFEHFPSGLAPLVVPGLTPVTGGSAGPLASLSDYVVDSAGDVFVQGAAGGVPGVLSVGVAGLAPLVRQGQQIPRLADGTDTSGRLFDGGFTLLSGSARGKLIFEAGVSKAGSAEAAKRGLFRLNAQGAVEGVLVEGLGVAGARNLTVDTLAPASVLQTVNGTTATAFLSKGQWQIMRTRTVVDAHGNITFTAVTVAQEGQLLPGGARIVSLDPGPVLDLPPGAGPVFTLNPAGDMAFLASDGQRWGIYWFVDAGQ